MVASYEEVEVKLVFRQNGVTGNEAMIIFAKKISHEQIYTYKLAV